VNYLQYFDWQWSNGLAPTHTVFAPIRMPFTLAFLSLGCLGVRELARRDRAVCWLLLTLFLTMGPGLVAYMNFKPGYSLAWNIYPSGEQHEVRERDYFFTVSFQTWGLFCGVGLAAWYQRWRARSGWRWPQAVFALALLPLALNFRAADRAHGPEAQLARDWAYDLLQSLEPHGVLFTNGDNDTFPLWYLQETEGVRQDVTVVNLSLANLGWYIRQLRDNPVRPFDSAQAPWYAGRAPREAPPPLHSLSDGEIGVMRPQRIDSAFSIRVGTLEHTYAAGTPFYVKDVLVLRLIQENLHRRPLYFSLTAGDESWVGLGDYLLQQGLVFRITGAGRFDPRQLGPGLFRTILDLGRTDTLAWLRYRYAGLLTPDSLDLDATSRYIANNQSLPFLALGQSYEFRGDRERALRNLRRAYHFQPSQELARYIASLEPRLVSPGRPDSTVIEERPQSRGSTESPLPNRPRARTP